jgi:hypothetical protein
MDGLTVLAQTTRNEKKQSEYAMFKHFIALTGEENFNRSFSYYFLEQEWDMKYDLDVICDEGFRMFHKEVRQVDYFDIGEGHVDGLYWNFLWVSDVPYDVLKELFFHIKNPDDHPYWNKVRDWSVFDEDFQLGYFPVRKREKALQDGTD